MRIYRDTETGATVTESELRAEYTENAALILDESGAATFVEWLNNCTGRNGFLERV